MRGRNRPVAATVIGGVAVLALVIGANILASQSTQAWDLTRYGNNTLAPQSVLAARNLTSDLEVIGLFRPTRPDDQYQTESLIALYAAQSPHLKYRSENIQADAVDVKKYGVNLDNTVVLDYRGKTQLLLEGAQSEQNFTTALLKLESDHIPTVCWATGDGEVQLTDDNTNTGYSAVANLLARNNFSQKDLLLSQITSVPSDCDELAIVNPTVPIGEKGVATVSAYLAAGGRLLLATTPWAKDPNTTIEVNAILKPYGQSFTGALVLDPNRSATNDPTDPAVIDYGKSPITDDIQGIYSFFPQPTAIVGTAVEGVTAVHVATTTSAAYAVAAIRKDLNKQSGDAAGPFTLVETLERASGNGKSRVVAVGTPAFASNFTMPPNSGSANYELALASFEWLAGEDSLIALPPKPGRGLPLVLSQQDQSNLIFVTAFLMPGIIVIAGIAVWWRRRIFS